MESKGALLSPDAVAAWPEAAAVAKANGGAAKGADASIEAGASYDLNEVPSNGRALGCFGPRHCLRRFACRVVFDYRVDGFM